LILRATKSIPDRLLEKQIPRCARDDKPKKEKNKTDRLRDRSNFIR